MEWNRMPSVSEINGLKTWEVKNVCGCEQSGSMCVCYVLSSTIRKRKFYYYCRKGNGKGMKIGINSLHCSLFVAAVDSVEAVEEKRSSCWWLFCAIKHCWKYPTTMTNVHVEIWNESTLLSPLYSFSVSGVKPYSILAVLFLSHSGRRRTHWSRNRAA